MYCRSTVNVNLRKVHFGNKFSQNFHLPDLPKVHCGEPQMQLQVAMGTAACTLRPDVYGDVIVTDGSPGVLVSFSDVLFTTHSFN